MVWKTVGFSAILATTSINAQAVPVQENSTWQSEVRMDTTKVLPVVLPEKEINIKVEPKPEPKPVQRQRVVVARERAAISTVATVPQGDIKQYAMRRSQEMFGDGHWPALEALWQRESGWNYLATNRSSGACGIPQANPCSKAGGDYRTNPYTQVEWGLKYIAARYGTPSGAWAFFQARHWY